MDTIRKIFDEEKPIIDGDNLVIDKIELINNELLEKKYNACTVMNEKILFHGTPLENIVNITTNGFDESYIGKGMCGHIGKGLYFSDLMCQSIYYQLKYEYTGEETEFTLIVCKVKLGCCLHMKRTKETINIYKLSDSHSTDYDQDGNKGKEYCIFNSEQILPYCLLHMKRVTSTSARDSKRQRCK